MSDTLYHLTFNTGNVSRTGRSEVRQDVIEALLPIVVSGWGPVPFMDGWYLHRVFTPPTSVLGGAPPGAAVFWIARAGRTSDEATVKAVTAWGERPSGGAWGLAQGGYAVSRPTLARIGGPGFSRQPPGGMPPSVPWLAAWLMPSITEASAFDLLAFGDLERCVAWAFQEASVQGLLR